MEGEKRGEAAPPGREPKGTQVRLGAIIALGVVAGFLVWLLFLRDGDGEEVQVGEEVAVAAEELSDVADSVGHEIYWVGERPDTTLELTRTGEGVVIRYLTDGAKLGDKRPDFLSVGTYRVGDGIAALRAAAEAAGGKPTELEGGGLLFVNPAVPSSAFLAYPDSELQIEVYDPTPDAALALAKSGAVQPVP